MLKWILVRLSEFWAVKLWFDLLICVNTNSIRLHSLCPSLFTRDLHLPLTLYNPALMLSVSYLYATTHEQQFAHSVSVSSQTCLFRTLKCTDPSPNRITLVLPGLLAAAAAAVHIHIHSFSSELWKIIIVGYTNSHAHIPTHTLDFSGFFVVTFIKWTYLHYFQML